MPSRRPRLLANLVVSLAFCVGNAASAATPPNFLLILLDDVGYADLGAYGGSFVATPRLDRLAAEGMRFTDYRSNGAVCTPSRAAILTGRYPLGLGLGDVLPDTSLRGLSADVETVADRLRLAGYATGFFGKWHLGSRPEHQPVRHGFDRSATGLKSNGPYVDPWVSFDGRPPVRYRGHRTVFATDQALGFIEANTDRPFFVTLAYNAAHRPYQPPPEWAALYPDTEAGRYAALLSHADAEIGRVLDALGDLGLESRTLVFVASDNGARVKAGLESNGPLRGHKRDLFEGGLRVPLLARWTGTIAPGSENASPFLGIDFLPTLVELAGATAPRGLPGQSMAEALLAARLVPRSGPVFWAGPDRLEPPSAAEGDFYRHAVLDGSRKLVRQTQGTEAAPLLFDLAADPGESVDLAPANSEAVAALERAHRSWSMAESRLPATLRHVSGAASIRSAWLRLAGGELQLATDGRATVHDGDMTFFAIVTPEWLVGEQVIAEQEGSWRLALGETGTLSLRVEGADGIAAEIESGARLAPGVSTEVAFTLFGWPRANSELRLYVDGQLEAQSRALSSMAAGEAWLRLGSSADGALPFHGMLWGPRLHLMSLPPAELVDIDQDGIANGDDACIGVADTAQRDSDSDGIGDACDADLDGDGIVGTADRVLLYKAFGSRAGQPGYEARCDFDGDGVVGLIDRALLEKSFGAPPGPSGRVCTPLDPCPAH